VEGSYPCPCCGHLTLGEPPGSYEGCPVCFWEDDVVQLRWPTWAGGANKPALIDAQRNFAAFGACEERFLTPDRAPMSVLDLRLLSGAALFEIAGTAR
jgi:hypothetical protein